MVTAPDHRDLLRDGCSRTLLKLVLVEHAVQQLVQLVELPRDEGINARRREPGDELEQVLEIRDEACIRLRGDEAVAGVAQEACLVPPALRIPEAVGSRIGMPVDGQKERVVLRAGRADAPPPEEPHEAAHQPIVHGDRVIEVAVPAVREDVDIRCRLPACRHMLNHTVKDRLALLRRIHRHQEVWARLAQIVAAVGPDGEELLLLGQQASQGAESLRPHDAIHHQRVLLLPGADGTIRCFVKMPCGLGLQQSLLPQRLLK